jgi:hypothetical protein
MSNCKTVNVKQAKDIHHYKNIKEKLYKTNAPILFNKLYKIYRLTPNHVHITVSGTYDRPMSSKTSASYGPVLQDYKRILWCLQTFYVQILMYFIIYLCFTYTISMFSNSLKMIKTDRNMSELWQIVCNTVIVTLVHLLVLLSEMLRYSERWGDTVRVLAIQFVYCDTVRVLVIQFVYWWYSSCTGDTVRVLVILFVYWWYSSCTGDTVHVLVIQFVYSWYSSCTLCSSESLKT